MITHIERFPEFMPNVKACKVVERKSKTSAVTSWRVDVDGVPLSWQQVDQLDLAHFTVSFKALDGDLEMFEGKWTLSEAESGGTKVDVEVSAKLGIPLVTESIGNVVGQTLRKNFEMMLEAMYQTITARRYKNIRDRSVSDLKGFAVIGHHYNIQHLVRYFKSFKPDMKVPSREFIAGLFDLVPSYKTFEIKGFKSKTGKTVDGCFIICPIIPDMIELSPERVMEKVVQACHVAEQNGMGIVVLGGFTSVVGEKYSKQLASSVHIPMTTGNALTVALVIDGIEEAAKLMGCEISGAKMTIIGGTGDIGSAVARYFSERVHEITITSRSEKNLMDTERTLFYYGKARIKTSRDSARSVRNADIVLAAASVSSSIIGLENFKPGAVICDVGYPKNISYTACDRKDIFIFSGGIAALPSEFNPGFDVGLPNTNVLYGCFTEAILLALEDRYENFSWGKGNISRDRVEYIRAAAKRHGFELAPFFWGNKLMTPEDIEKIRVFAKGIPSP
jgi:fatty aldehyde-generating acyl-ACP reductase